MLRFIFVCGLLLIAVSVYSYVQEGGKSHTIWIPAALGALIAFRAWWARQSPTHLRLALWSIRFIALLGLGACVWMLSKAGFAVDTLARQAQAATAVLCLAALLATLRR
jgi:hypothetical protein